MAFYIVSTNTIAERYLVDPFQERLDIAEWLSSLNFKASQLEFLQRRQAGTGEWLLESSKFKDWRNGILRELWCPGIREMTCVVFSTILVSPTTEQLVLARPF